MRLRDLPYTTEEIFPPGDYGFQMRFRRGGLREFYAPSPDRAAILAERSQWIRETPSRCALLLPGAEPLLEEALALAREHGAEAPAAADPLEQCRLLGAHWEPDFMLLRPGASGRFELFGGAICFPSAWSFEEKMGRPLEEIHAPVPGLNDALAAPIHQFLGRIRPGLSWERANWGLSRSPELNQHPHRQLPRLDGNVTLDQVWFRLEYQSLVALPQSGGILFGIRLVIEPLAALQADAAFRAGLANALRTMPAAVARYKGIAEAQARLLELLPSGCVTNL